MSLLSRITGFLSLRLKPNHYDTRHSIPDFPTETLVSKSEVVLLIDNEIICSVMLFTCQGGEARIGFKALQDIEILRCNNTRVQDDDDFKKQLNEFHERINQEHQALRVKAG